MNEELKPLLFCPFCLGIADIKIMYTCMYRIFCTNCGIATRFYHSENKAIEIWNTRA